MWFFFVFHLSRIFHNRPTYSSSWTSTENKANCPLDCAVSSCLMMGLKFWRIYECWWLPWFLISNKTWKGLRILFASFHEKYVLYIYCFICQAFLPVHIIINDDVPLHPTLLAPQKAAASQPRSPLPTRWTRTVSAGTRHTTKNVHWQKTLSTFLGL